MSNVTGPPRDVAAIPEGYAIVPHSVARNTALSVQARLLFVLIDGHIGKRKGFTIPQSTLAAEMNMTVRNVRRYVRELEQAGIITTTRTKNVAVSRVVNPSRKDTDVRSKRTQMSGRNRSNNLELTTAAQPTANPKPTALPSPVVVAEYLNEIHKATRVRIGTNTTVRTYLAAIVEQGITPADAGAIAAAYVAAHTDIRNPFGFVAGFVLPAIAAGERPERKPSMPTAPLMYMQRLAKEPCRHEDPLGEQACPLCRHDKAGAMA